MIDHADVHPRYKAAEAEITAYLAGASIRAIAEQRNVSYGRQRDRLIRAGIPLRRRGGNYEYLRTLDPTDPKPAEQASEHEETP